MGTVGKALDLLGVFSRARPSVGLSDLARLTGVNKATCFRLMADLQARGFVEQWGPAREYRLGPAVLGLAALREAHVPTREAALPVLHRLALATGETAHLSHRVGDDLRTLAFAYAQRHGTNVMMEDADLLSWHATASGQVMLAFLPEDQVTAILSGPLARLTPATLTDAGAIRTRLTGIRAAGLAETAGTFEAEVHGHAAPLFGPDGACTGAVAVAAPIQRVTAETAALIRRELVRAAAEITALWGGQAPGELTGIWARAA